MSRRTRATGTRWHHAGSFVAGVLCANSLAHLGTAAAGREHLTPLAGKASGRGMNGLWGALNLAGGLALLAGVAPRRGRRWDSRLIAFDIGAAVFAVWMAASEAVLRVNTR